jgi:hypothetical protein
MADILGKIIHPELGDITMDVARELAAMRQADDAQIANEAEARQVAIAAAMGQEGRTFRGGHQIAQIDARVHDYWRRREGPDFWKHELGFMRKRHPELRVVSRSAKATIRVPRTLPAIAPARTGVFGKRGRWAA